MVHIGKKAHSGHHCTEHVCFHPLLKHRKLLALSDPSLLESDVSKNSRKTFPRLFPEFCLVTSSHLQCVWSISRSLTTRAQ